jgi:hypothetical protein
MVKNEPASRDMGLTHRSPGWDSGSVLLLQGPPHLLVLARQVALPLEFASGVKDDARVRNESASNETPTIVQVVSSYPRILLIYSLSSGK